MKFTPWYKQIYGYVGHIQGNQLQGTLFVWRKRYWRYDPSYKIIVLHNDMLLHPKPDTINKTSCSYSSLGKYFIIVCCFILKYV